MKKTKKRAGFFRRLMTGATVASTAMALTSSVAMAGFDKTVTVADGDMDAGQMMGNVIGILLTITRFVGIALIIYGVYEIVMSFMQNQPEAKTKGIIMALAGVVMAALESVLKAMKVIA